MPCFVELTSCFTRVGFDKHYSLALSARDDHMVENQGVLMTAMRTMDTTSGARCHESTSKVS